ncbi:MAG: ABC transporter substrate-binding protein [Butyricicoccus pullicaecorum]|nr:carbohydrate ABC transporter substrate-binding protein [Butyricicoccus pullicaecorum]MDO4668710.1 ABC transporter substrate-binding protein [Butyricicoccus pullicaecorum]
MKKFLALALSASMTLALAGCGGNSDQAANNASTGENTTITLWTYPIGSWGGTDSKLDDIIANFNKVHPEITVKYETLDYQNGDNQVTSAITSNNTPDIIMEGPERLVSNWGAAGKMVDLSDLWADTKDDIAAVSESVVNACQLDGKFYEYPLCMTTHCMAINYELFEKANALQYIDEETRTWTTDNFVKAMEAVRDSGLAPVPGIIYCGGTGGDQGTRALVNNLYSGQYTNAEHTAYTANSPENVKGLELLKSMVDSKALNANAGFVASDELQQFANGTSAVTFCWNASNESQYASQVQFTPYAMAFPSDDGKPELCGGIWGFGVFDNGDQARIDAAKTFIKFVCDDAAQGVESVRLTGFFPVRASQGDVYEGTEDAERMANYTELMPYLGDYYNVTPNWTEQRNNWFNMLQEVMVKGTPAQTAADNFVSASNP